MQEFFGGSPEVLVPDYVPESMIRDCPLSTSEGAESQVHASEGLISNESSAGASPAWSDERREERRSWRGELHGRDGTGRRKPACLHPRRTRHSSTSAEHCEGSRKIRACIYSLDRVSSCCEADYALIAWPEHMFFKQRSEDKLTSPGARRERPRVHVTRGGVFYVDVEELLESQVGQESLRKAERLAKRLGLEPAAREVETLASARTSSGD